MFLKAPIPGVQWPHEYLRFYSKQKPSSLGSVKEVCKPALKALQMKVREMANKRKKNESLIWGAIYIIEVLQVGNTCKYPLQLSFMQRRDKYSLSFVLPFSDCACHSPALLLVPMVRRSHRPPCGLCSSSPISPTTERMPWWPLLARGCSALADMLLQVSRPSFHFGLLPLAQHWDQLLYSSRRCTFTKWVYQTRR